MTEHSNTRTRTPDLAVLISLSGQGGVERMVLNLVRQMAEQGLHIDLVLIRDESRHLGELPSSVNIVRLGTRHSGLSVAPLRRYLQARRPPVLLVAKDRAGRAALVARQRARVDTRIFIRLGTTLSEALEGKSGLHKWWRYRPMRRLYPQADGIIAVSRGVAEDVVHITGMDPGRVHVIRNPVITPDLHDLAREEAPHPWLTDAGDPVILAMGRLTRQKDFPTLLRAFAMVQQDIPARLIILGEGADRSMLLGLADALGITARILLPGFQANPYAWLGRARLFVLSSAWEGSPNALTEAMALGIPVVSTDCRSGPREILQDGRFGTLVPVGDATALAQAMKQALTGIHSPGTLTRAVEEYRSEVSVTQYLRVMGATTRGQPAPAGPCPFTGHDRSS